MGRRTAPDHAPRWAIVNFEHRPYVLDLDAMRRAIVRGQLAGKFGHRDELAAKAEVSRSSLSRCVMGRTTSLALTVRILNCLHLEFDAVCQPIDPPIVAQHARTAHGVTYLERAPDQLGLPDGHDD